MSMQYWLMKTEPQEFSLLDLKQRPQKTSAWDGVRNYLARNYMRQMKRGDLVLFYHSSCGQPGVVGLAEIVREYYPDPSSFDPASPHYDAKSSPERPRWLMVDVQWKEEFQRLVSLKELKAHPHLQSMIVVQKGRRPSVHPVSSEEFSLVCLLGRSLE